MYWQAAVTVAKFSLYTNKCGVWDGTEHGANSAHFCDKGAHLTQPQNGVSVSEQGTGSAFKGFYSAPAVCQLWLSRVHATGQRLGPTQLPNLCEPTALFGWRVKELGCEDDHAHPFSTEIQNALSCLSTPYLSSWNGVSGQGKLPFLGIC